MSRAALRGVQHISYDKQCGATYADMQLHPKVVFGRILLLDDSSMPSVDSLALRQTMHWYVRSKLDEHQLLWLTHLLKLQLVDSALLLQSGARGLHLRPFFASYSHSGLWCRYVAFLLSIRDYRRPCFGL